VAQPWRGSREAREKVQREHDGARWRRENENERDSVVKGDKLRNEQTTEQVDRPGSYRRAI